MTETIIKCQIINEVKKWPNRPGVYIMRDASSRIIYVGKAKNLRKRVLSYFKKDKDLDPKTRMLLKKIHSIEFNITLNELEALLLECTLIKKHRPLYNIRLKDDKNYPYIVFNLNHKFPNFYISRRVEHSSHLRYFGPYDTGVRELTKFIKKTFRIRDCSQKKFSFRQRPCLSYDIGLCTGPCTGLVSEDEYKKRIEEAFLFLSGKKDALIFELTKEMKEASRRLKFEVAKECRDKIRAINEIFQNQNVVLLNHKKDIDIITYVNYIDEIVFVILFIRSGFLIGKKIIRTSIAINTTTDILETFLSQLYLGSVLPPEEIWIEKNIKQRKNIEKLIFSNTQKKVKIKIVKKKEHENLFNIAKENAKASAVKERSASQDIKDMLSLVEPPELISGIDVSNLEEKAPVVSIVSFYNETPDKKMYRLYYPRLSKGQDDTGMIYEGVLRHFKRAENIPDLLVVDGGKAQLSAALRALKELNINIPICAIAKSRVERDFYSPSIKKSEERIFVPFQKNPIIPKESRLGLRLIQMVRNEAHRFALKAHKTRRSKVGDSWLINIPGVGEATRIKILKAFENLEAFMAASFEDLIKAGLSAHVAKAICEYKSHAR